MNGTATLEDSLPFSPCYGEIAEDNDIAANDGCGSSWPSKVPGAGPNIHKGKFDPIALTVPYLPTSPHPLTPYGTTGSTFGAYARPQAGTWGTGGRNSLCGPGFVNFDASLAKNFTLYKDVKIQVIVQGFNIFNHVNLAGPSSCIDCGRTSGDIQGTASEQYGTSMRFLQFAGRLTF